ncbi:MAG TPA: tetratricopeptide repeat protein [Thermoanaerobaculia bacterium]|nr:tetratricopeptide repeat protein [Thermoanaerobaculia bacterium]
MRVPLAVVLSFALAPSILAAPRITFDRSVAAPHDLGKAEEVAIINALGDTLHVDAFVTRFVEHASRSGRLRMRDARRALVGRADAYLVVKNYTCNTQTRSAEGNAYDVDGNKVRRQFTWFDAVCMARIDVSAGKQQFSFAVKGEGTSPRVEQVTDEEKNIALDQATRYAAVSAAEKITPRRVRESIVLDEEAPAFEEGWAHISVGQFEGAREVWEEALRKDVRSASLHYNLGALCEALGDRKAAEQHYVAAKQLAPGEGLYASEYKSFMRRKP